MKTSSISFLLIVATSCCVLPLTAGMSTLIISPVFSQTPQGASPEVVANDNAIVLPVETQLQKDNLGIDVTFAKPISFVAVNENRLWSQNQLAEDEVWAKLKGYLTGKVANNVVLMRYRSGRFPKGDLAGEIGNRIKDSFPEGTSFLAQPFTNSSNDSWPQMVQLAKSRTSELKDNDESPVGDENLTVYPVQTPLSKLLFGDTSFFVRVLAIKEDDGFVNKEIEKKISALLKRSDANKDRALMFELVSVTANADWQKKVEKQFRNLTKELGFKSLVVRHHVNGVERLESLKLVGRDAPGFSLPTYSDSKQLTFPSSSRHEIVLLNFFGAT